MMWIVGVVRPEEYVVHDFGVYSTKRKAMRVRAIRIADREVEKVFVGRVRKYAGRGGLRGSYTARRVT